MVVNFTGLKNIYGIKINETIQNKPNHLKEHVYLNIHLKDDPFGRDLSQYKRVIGTTDIITRCHPVNPDFINVSTIKSTVLDSGIEKSRCQFFINGEPLRVNRQNMKFFTYLASLLKNIQKIPEENLIVNKDFLTGDEMASSLILDDKIQLVDLRKYLYQLFDKSNINLRANELMQNIQDCMEKYFNV